MKPLLDLVAPILPAQGLAGLKLGPNIGKGRYRDLLSAADSNYMSWAGVFSERANVWQSSRGFWEITYRLPQIYAPTAAENRASSEAFRRVLAGHAVAELVSPEVPERGPDSVEVRVDVRDGTVFALCALAGYEGSLLEQIRVGMTAGAAMAAETRLYASFTKYCGGLEVNGVPGVFLVLKRDGEFLPDDFEGDVDDAIIDEIWVFDPKRSDDGGLAW